MKHEIGELVKLFGKRETQLNSFEWLIEFIKGIMVVLYCFLWGNYGWLEQRQMFEIFSQNSSLASKLILYEKLV